MTTEDRKWWENAMAFGVILACLLLVLLMVLVPLLSIGFAVYMIFR